MVNLLIVTDDKSLVETHSLALLSPAIPEIYLPEICSVLDRILVVNKID